MRSFFFLFLGLLVSFQLFAQKYSFIAYSTERGLPQSQVTAISQDNDGYLWVGTLGGLAKFNGDKFTTYSSDNGLLNNRIKSLNYFENTLWVGHDGGISTIHFNKIKSYAFSDNDKSRNVSKIIRFHKKLLVCSNGGGLFELKGNKLTKISLGNEEFDRIRGAFVDDDILYLATRGGILISSNGKTFTLSNDFKEDSYSGVTGFQDELVVTTYTDIYRKNKKTGKINTVHLDEKKYRIKSCFIDHESNIWVCTDEGVIRLNQQNKLRYFDVSNGLPLNIISCIYEDKYKNIWFGSQGKGIFRFPGESFIYYDQRAGMPSNLFVSGFQSENGDYFLGSYDVGIVKRNKNGRITTLNTGDFTIWAAQNMVDGKMWFGTESSMVSIDENGKFKSYFKEDNLPGSKVTAFYKINDHDMYIGGSEGVSLYKNGKITKLGRKDAEFIGTVRDFEVVNGKLYCVTNLGLFTYEDNEFKVAFGVDNVVYNLEKDINGNLWFGTEEGLFRIRDHRVQRIQLLKDPASNYINFLNYKDGKMYVGTNNGLFIVNNVESDETPIDRYGLGDGIVDLETNLNSSFFDQLGNFWFGTASGLVCFKTTKEYKELSPPIVHLKSVLLNYQPFVYSQYSNKLTKEGLPSSLSLPYSKNNLIFELDGISLEHHQGLQYQFILDGLSDNWSPLSANSTITFTSLPAGSYVLKMKAVNINGTSSKIISIPFIIKPAFYKTWWFILMCIVLFALLVYTFVRIRIKRINEINEKEKLEIKTRLLQLEQKSVNASMNRHFIFNSLNSIQYFINTQDRLAANKYLTNFAQLIRKNLDSASADGNRISLEEELTRLRLYLSLEAMRFKDRFDYSINVEGVDTESVMIPSMIMQPFVENSIIHGILPDESKKGNIKVTVKMEEEYLKMEITDNGIGVRQSLASKVGIDGDHRSQGMEITSKRIELIQKIAHKDMSLIGPEEIMNSDGSINGTRVLIKIHTKDLEL